MSQFVLVFVSTRIDANSKVMGGGGRPLRVWYGNPSDVDPSRSSSLSTIGGSTLAAAVAWAPDGSSLAVGTMDGFIKMFREHLEAKTGAWSYEQGYRALTPPSWDLVSTLSGHATAVTAVSWEPVTGDEEGSTKEEGARTLSRLVSGSTDFAVRVWQCDERDGRWRDVAVLADHGDAVTAVSWAPYGMRFVSGSADRTVRVWQEQKREGGGEEREPNSFEAIMSLSGHKDMVTEVRWCCQDNRELILSASNDSFVHIWHFTGEAATLLNTLDGHDGPITAAAWAPDSTNVVTGGHDATLRIWQEVTEDAWVEVARLEEHTAEVTSAAWSPDGQTIVSGSADKVTRVWHQRSDNAWKCSRLGLGAVTRHTAPGKSGAAKSPKKHSAVDWEALRST
eukprot:TRINITY_DN15714_c0_g1_i1.p1 TRINITY_DN15714_c0_g1~~TRINITY_DN15714_c0_g1_i1.p1  ORF type:complete len:394 (-),score=42.41 TRINITY_DN15714_c0_g1_i1:260-1441(-)